MKVADSRGEITRPRYDSEPEDEGDRHSRGQPGQALVLQLQQLKPQHFDRTLEVFQRHTSKVLTREDARQIAENVTGFFQILMEWEAAVQHDTNKINKTTPNAVSHSTGGPLE